MNLDQVLFIRIDSKTLKYLNREAKKRRQQGEHGKTGAGTVARDILVDSMEKARR